MTWLSFESIYSLAGPNKLILLRHCYWGSEICEYVNCLYITEGLSGGLHLSVKIQLLSVKIFDLYRLSVNLS